MFAGSDPNGTWRLVVVDQAWQDGGELVGWGLDVSTVEPSDPGHPIEVVFKGGLTPSQQQAFDLEGEFPLRGIEAFLLIQARQVEDQVDDALRQYPGVGVENVDPGRGNLQAAVERARRCASRSPPGQST